MNVNEVFVADISDPETGVVAASVSVEIEGRWFDANGSSKCDPGDDFRYETGLQIALGRALKKLGGKVERAGHKYVAKQDHVRDAARPEFREPVSIREARLAFNAKVLEFLEFGYQDHWSKLHEVDSEVDALAFDEAPELYRVPVGWNP